jgi:hypothetical protein
MDFNMPILIPYVINMCYIKNLFGFATKVNLQYKILEEIAEHMVYSISEKVHSIQEYCEKIGNTQNVEVFFFEDNCWKSFEIDNFMLIIIYIEKYNKYYVESEEYDNNDEMIMSYSNNSSIISISSNTDYWDNLMNLHNNAKQKIYESHMCLQENDKYDMQYNGYFDSCNNYLEYISSESTSTDSNDEK